MLNHVTIRREIGDRRRGDVLDVAERLKGPNGSATNVVVQMVRQSALFRHEMRKIEAEAAEAKQGARKAATVKHGTIA